MRTRLLALASVSLIAAGCGSAALGSGGGPAATSAAGSPPNAAASAPAAAASASPAGNGQTTGSAAGQRCSGQPAAPVTGGSLTGLQFASPAQGWVVGQDTILATTDGGAHWRPQLTGTLNLTSVDFVNGQAGWAVGTTSLLATTDGGARWTALPEPCPAIRSVHFISPQTGFAVAGGSDLGLPGEEPLVPSRGGAAVATTDGGRTWHAMTTPASAQTICFTDSRHGWLGAAGLLYQTADGGTDWTARTSLAGQVGTGHGAVMEVQCANDGSAWALRVGPGAAMNQEPHVGFHADQAGATALFAERYFQNPGANPTRSSPGGYAGPFSALSASAAVFVDSCPACGLGTAPWALVTGSGATITAKGNVGAISEPTAASFLSAEVGYVVGVYLSPPATPSGPGTSQQRIVATTDGGRTWHVEYATRSSSD